MIVSDQEILFYMGIYPTAFAINMLYPQTTPPPVASYWFNAGFEHLNFDKFAAGQHDTFEKYATTFDAAAQNVVAITFEPAQDQCLWVLGPRLANVRGLTAPASTWLGVSNPARIQALAGDAAAGADIWQRARCTRGATTTRRPILPPSMATGRRLPDFGRKPTGVGCALPTASSCCRSSRPMPGLTTGSRHAALTAQAQSSARPFHVRALRPLEGFGGHDATFCRAGSDRSPGGDGAGMPAVTAASAAVQYNEIAVTSIAALVPMRHHSQRVPGKNYRTLDGKPLFHHILQTLLAVPEIDQIAVDTDSDVVISGLRDDFPRVLRHQPA